MHLTAVTRSSSEPTDRAAEYVGARYSVHLDVAFVNSLSPGIDSSVLGDQSCLLRMELISTAVCLAAAIVPWQSQRAVKRRIPGKCILRDLTRGCSSKALLASYTKFQSYRR